MSDFKNQDLHLFQQDLYHQYVSTFSTNIDAAHDLIIDEDTDVDNSQYAIHALMLNDLGTAVNGMEQYWWGDVIDVLNEDATIFQERVENISTRPIPTWEAGTLYDINDVVTYNNNTYLCTHSTLEDTDINDNNYWLSMPLQGDPGYNSFGIIFKGEWAVNNAYNQYDCVFVTTGKTTNLYVSNVAITNSNVTPAEDSRWVHVLTIDRNYMPYVDTMPASFEYPYNWVFLCKSSEINGVTNVQLYNVRDGSPVPLSVQTITNNVYIDCTNMSNLSLTGNQPCNTVLQRLYNTHNL